MLTEEVKTFIEKFCTLLLGMDHWELWENSLPKDEKRLDWTNLQRICLKVDVQAHAWSDVSLTVRKAANERRDRRFGLMLVWWWMVDILNIGWNAN